jgi:hypothetical protein
MADLESLHHMFELSRENLECDEVSVKKDVKRNIIDATPDVGTSDRSGAHARRQFLSCGEGA